MQAGYDACARQSPDFVFLDLHIPGGFEFLTYQRSLLGDRQPRVLVCTIASDDPELDGAFRNGADDFILKPFDREVMEARLREIGLLAPLLEPDLLALADI